MKYKNIFVIVSIFLVVLCNSVIYGAINSEMFIDGDAYVRVDSDIRITELEVLEQNNGAYETYRCNYSKDTTGFQVTLPNSNSSIIYEVTITNKSSDDYVLFDLIEESYSNSNIKYELIDLEEGSVIGGETIYTFKIRLFTLENDSNNSGIIILKYDFSLYDEKVWLFDSVGNEQEFIVPYDGVYKLEVWGAQGGSYETYYGGYGGYSSGEVSLVKDDILYINVGSQGEAAVGVNVTCSGGYNGGGAARSFNYPTSQSCGGGGGATHISLSPGLLSTLSSRVGDVLIVAGGGGGGAFTNHMNYGNGGHGGGCSGSAATSDASDRNSNGLGSGGTQLMGGCRKGNSGDRCGSFGQGYSNISNSGSTANSGGGGGGYYGGGGTWVNAGGGGSGYIGNVLLSNKTMYCFNCDESNEESTRTITTTNISEEAVSNFAKKGNGYAKLSLVSKK